MLSISFSKKIKINNYQSSIIVIPKFFLYYLHKHTCIFPTFYFSLENTIIPKLKSFASFPETWRKTNCIVTFVNKILIFWQLYIFLASCTKESCHFQIISKVISYFHHFNFFRSKKFLLKICKINHILNSMIRYINL